MADRTAPPAPARDGVDAILDQWKGARPDLDCAPMGIVGRISRASRLLERALKDEFARHGIEPWEFDVLGTLLRSGPPHVLCAGDLSAAAMVSSAALTNRVDRLLDKGLVERRVDPSHRRRVLVSLSDKGLRVANDVLEHHVANERRLLAALSADQQTHLAEALRTLLLDLGDTAPDQP
ncbi:MarR family winged helix-turn-helix transcriptional regulator [Actinomadura oligospora]|uniref:MarR family winged helix-turn-helix transcriptional regulator n=1 Tax=Actinomadura oligospora TaxID=111804 RepID=UPI00047EF84C|nr:MarR family transcriptional regulator [Actinomadura oligospora]